MTYTFQSKSTNLLLAILLHTLSATAQNGDGGATNGYSNTDLGASGTGAEGSSSSSANLSRGAIIAISVVVGFVVVGGVTLAVLFYLAKKRQWQVRQTIRRTATNVVRAMTPRTPAKMSFSPLSPRADKGWPSPVIKSKPMDNEKNDRDLEKGFRPTELRVDTSGKPTVPAAIPHPRKENPERLLNTVLKKNTNVPAPVQTSNVPTSHFDMDSPKSPLWTKFLGRK